MYKGPPEPLTLHRQTFLSTSAVPFYAAPGTFLYRLMGLFIDNKCCYSTLNILLKHAAISHQMFVWAIVQYTQSKSTL